LRNIRLAMTCLLVVATRATFRHYQGRFKSSKLWYARGVAALNLSQLSSRDGLTVAVSGIANSRVSTVR
jgi:beta-lactamase regulating signal transducer with metallopeptidase domain